MKKDNGKIEIWGAETARTFRPIWTAEELGLNYIHHPIEPRTGETRTEAYTKLNPKQKVPFLVDKDIHVSESLAICRYLTRKYPSDGLAIPNNLTDSTKEDEWCCYIFGEIDETALYVMRRHGDLAEIYGAAPEAIESARSYLSRHMNVLANHIEDRDSMLEFGFGLADIMLISCLDWALFYGVDVPDTLLGYHKMITKREAYKKAIVVNYPKLFGGANGPA